jgi:hypothetical protein
MSKKTDRTANEATKLGRPERPLVIPGDWKDAVKQAMAKGKPPAPAKRSKKKKAAKKAPKK